MHRTECQPNRRGSQAVTPRTNRLRRAFTMIELLIVIAITVILFGLLIRPLVDTLRYTKDAQLEAAAQDSARKTMEMLSREIGSAAYVSDNATYAFNTTDQSKLDSTVTGALREQYSNFLNVNVPEVDTSGNPVSGGTYAHIYNAKLDLVMARHQVTNSSNGTNLTDPTAGNEPINITNSSLANGKGNYITSTPLMFPLAPGTTMIRYFIGLKDPDHAYSNARDHVNGAPGAPDNNTYVLYRAQFNPDALVAQPSAGVPIKYLLFDKDGNNQPILDDPDFFRPVTTNDVNWLDPAHAKYDTQHVIDHNARYEQWKMIAKPVINAPEIDLLMLPHNFDRTIAYDTTSGADQGPFPGIAHYGADHDPVTGTDYPIERTSITFMPGAVSTDAAPSTTSDYQERGIAGGTNGVASGLPYIPTQYQSVGQAWTRPYFVYLYPETGTNGSVTPNTSTYYYITQAITSVAASGNTSAITAGDVVEYEGSTPVYDLTTHQILATNGDVIPASVNEDTGTIDFSTPAIPGAGASSSSSVNVYNRTWNYTPPSNANTGNNSAAFPATNILDLTQKDDSGNVSPLNNEAASSLSKFLNYAFIVPGSLRVYGPDMTSGPGTPINNIQNGNPNVSTQPVLYTEVSANTVPGPNQYQVNYFTSQITFMSLDQLGTTGQPFYWPSGFQVIYDYQANMRPADPAQQQKPISSTNPGYPLSIKVIYHSRDALNVSIGVRYIDSLGNAQDVVLSNSVKVGNINR